MSGITASVIFNRLYRFGPTQFISTAMILLAVSLAFMLVSASYTATMFTLAFIWGIGISCIGLALQMRVLQLAPDATDVASAIYSGIFNAGIGAGALFGNQIARHVGLEYIGFTGAALAMIALGILSSSISAIVLKTSKKMTALNQQVRSFSFLIEMEASNELTIRIFCQFRLLISTFIRCFPATWIKCTTFWRINRAW